MCIRDSSKRVLFLVDRLELEDQAKKAFAAVLSADYQTVIYKENRDDWRRAEIVVTTVQSLLFNNKYQKLFSPTDFDLVISDEAHRSIGGNARAVFDYFIGYKLGLTAVNAGVNLQRRAGAKVQHGRKQEGPRYRGLSCLSRFFRSRRPAGLRWRARPWHGVSGAWSERA